MRRFEKLGLKRRGNIVNMDIVQNHIEKELMDSACYLMGLQVCVVDPEIEIPPLVPRETVANILREIDPEASAMRQQRRGDSFEQGAESIIGSPSNESPLLSYSGCLWVYFPQNIYNSFSWHNEVVFQSEGVPHGPVGPSGSRRNPSPPFQCDFGQCPYLQCYLDASN